MTDDELRELVASLAVSQKESDRRIQETDRQIQETDRQMQETDRRMQETDRQMQETDRRMQETERFIKEVGRQIGGLGQKFGSFTEGMAFPSMRKLLRERLGMGTIMTRVASSRNGGHMELDVLGYSNGADNRLVVVEVKSRLTQEGIEQMERTMAGFDAFFPEHAHRRRFGIIAAVDVPTTMEEQTRKRGFYLARIQDELFVLEPLPSFQPRYFGAA